MLSVHGRRPIKPIVEPVAAAFNRAGISPNAVTIAGTVVSVAIAVLLIPSGHLVAAAIAMAVFTAFDLLDGTMARLRGGGTKYGATLDASCDRITDAALFGSIAAWIVYSYGAPKTLLALTLITMGASQVISYVKARAEASGLKVDGGLVERAERLIIALLGIGLQGLGVTFALEAAMWLLCLGSVFTVVQRLYMVARHPGALERIAPPSGAEDYETRPSEGDVRGRGTQARGGDN
nr:CDP-alcohol phosphatidyltransferase family protein [Corynebacterium lactis]